MTNETRYNGFGYWIACPYPVRIAWGARAILEQDGTFSLVYDRVDWNGVDSNSARTRKQFADLINGALPDIRNAVRSFVDAGTMQADEECEFVLFENEKLKVIGNTNGSYGYLYLVAFPPK